MSRRKRGVRTSGADGRGDLLPDSGAACAGPDSDGGTAAGPASRSTAGRAAAMGAPERPRELGTTRAAPGGGASRLAGRVPPAETVRPGAASAGEPVPSSTPPGIAARTLTASASRARARNTTRLPSRVPRTRPARSSACRCRLVHDCDSFTAAASALTLRSTPPSSRSSSWKRLGGASEARASWRRE